MLPDIVYIWVAAILRPSILQRGLARHTAVKTILLKWFKLD